MEDGAARLDGANGLQIFRDITWPAIAPIAATVVLIRLIEAFKIVDLPNVLTGGGPGLATESMTLHSFISWRTQDLGSSAAVGYMLLFISTVVCEVPVLNPTPTPIGPGRLKSRPLLPVEVMRAGCSVLQMSDSKKFFTSPSR